MIPSLLVDFYRNPVGAKNQTGAGRSGVTQLMMKSDYTAIPSVLPAL
jgi:hypothetical protein